jgi:hypothetical protein
MRFMMLVKAAENVPPVPELYAAIGQLAQEMAQKGVLLDMGGLASSAQGTRIRLAGSRLTITDGPFTEAKELVGGFSVMSANSREDAIELGRRFMQVHADILGADRVVELEVRQIIDPPTRHA